MGARILLIVKKISYIGALVCSLLCIITGPAYSQEIPAISINSLQPVGSGARAIGMGGAFIGVADDATAASWNPAGLIQLKRSEISFVGDFFSIDPEEDKFSDKSDFELNYFSFVYPAYLINRNMVFSLNYQNLYHINSEGHDNIVKIIEGTPWTENNRTYYKNKGSISAVSPALAIQLAPSFTLGVTLNIWPKRLLHPNGWEHSSYWDNEFLSSDPNNPSQHFFRYEEAKYELEPEINYYIGLRLKLNSIFTFGAVYKSPLSPKFKRERELSENSVPDDLDLPDELCFPESYGMGIAARINDNFTVDLDIYHTEWNKYSLPFLEDGESLKSINYIRFGGEYLFILPRSIIPFRFGLFYDPEPSQADHKNIDWPNGCSLGTGLSLKTISMDIAVKYRKVEDNKLLKDSNLNIVSTDIEELFLYFSIIYYI